MTMLASLKTSLNRDQLGEWLVIALTLSALLLGWGLRATVESRTMGFTADGITARVPAGWLWRLGSGMQVLHATDPASAGFSTTYNIETRPVVADAKPEQLVGVLSLERGQRLTAYRVLDQQPLIINGREAYKTTFVYVEANPTLTHKDLPSVVHGVDFVFINGSRAIIVTYEADENAYDTDFAEFRRFLDSITF